MATAKQRRKANERRRAEAALKQAVLDPDAQAGVAEANAAAKREADWQRQLREAAVRCGRDRQTVEIEEHPSYPEPRRRMRFEPAPAPPVDPSARLRRALIATAAAQLVPAV